MTLLIYQGITYAAPPTFDDGNEKTVSVAENTAIDTEIVRLPVTDPDNDISDRSLITVGNLWERPGDFTINSIRTETNQYVVVIKNTVTLDYETQTSYHYTVYVSDENGESDSISVTINITNDPSDDTPNNPPMFTDSDSTTRSIAENMPGGTAVGSAISATDSDSDDTLTYRLDVTGDINSFSINSSTGQLSSSTQFDYETKNSYEVTVTVSDGRGGTDSISVSISVTNDPSDDITPNSAPTFTDGDSTTRSIAENMPGGTAVGSAISATDSDSDDTLTYRLDVTGDINSFSINSSTGQLSSSTQFDYETKNSYEVTVTVSDGRGGTDSISVSISVTNDPSDDITPNSAPTFTDGDSTTRSIAENMPGGTAVGSAISATDSDNSDTLRYSLGGTDAGSFSINSSTGQLSTSTQFDYETKNSYEVTVTVSDGREGTDSISVSISVTNDPSDDPTPNNPPLFDDGDEKTVSVSENTAINTEIVRLPVTDPDNDIVGALMFGNPWARAGDFTIDSIRTETGQYVVVIKNTVTLDYETQTSYHYTVYVSDENGESDSISVTINITNDPSDDTPNNPPMFTDGDSTTRSIAENMLGGTEVGSAISATDSDSDDTLTYRLDVTGDINSFSINSSTGQLSSSTQFDYETKNSYEVTVTVSDGRGGTDSISVSISVTNDPSDDITPNSAPTFTDGGSTTRSIAENMPGGTEVGSAISATDSDNSDTLRYSLSGTDAGSFSINSSTGQLSSSTQFDYETKNSYEVTVTVSDGREGTDSISVSISVTNDPSDDITPNSAPTFTDGGSTTRSIAENMPGGTAVGSAISATDSDNSDTLRYSLSGTDAGSFSINSSTGQLSSSTRFDYETKNSYEVTVTVSDGREGTDSISVTISITNDTSDDSTPNNPPLFDDGDEKTVSVAENTAINTEIVRLPVTDPDNDISDRSLITVGNPWARPGDFTIESIRTETDQYVVVIKNTVTLDYETQTSYHYTVYVSDENGESDSISVTINITNDPSDDTTNPPPPLLISISSSNSNPEPGDTVTFTAGVQQNNNPAEGQTLTFSVSPDDGTASLNSTSATTGSDGQAQTTLTLGSDASGSYTVTASVGTISTSGSVDVEILQTSQQQNADLNTDTQDSQTVPKDDTDPNQQQSETETQQNTNPNTGTQQSGVEQQDSVQQPSDPGQSTPDESTPAEPTPEEPPRVISKFSVPGQISFSEIMIASEGGLHSRAQWIEVYNNSATEAVNLKGWHLEIEARDGTGAHRHVVIPLEDLPISANQTVLIVTWSDRNSGDFPEDRIYKLFNHHSDEFDQNDHRNMVLGRVGFYLKLSDPDGAVNDIVGNLDGDSKTEDEPAWELPSGMTEDRARTSLLRRYAKDTGMPLDGTELNNWKRASELELSVMRYWGHETDIGNPGYRGEGALPVTLSHFRAERVKSGVVLKWTTESELDNAGFNILRTESRDGAFRQVNSRMIQGAGTTGERNTYTWTDTTAKPDIVYYYRIEDVSFAGSRNQLATVRTRGQISASEKHITQWGNLKKRN